MSSSETRASAVAQLEFYFSPSNLARDKFLRQALTEGGGSVALSVVLSFKKLQKLSLDPAELVEWLGADTTQVVVLPGGEEGVRVAPADLEAAMAQDTKEADSRTVVVRNIPHNSSIESVRELFAPAGTVQLVRLIQGQRSQAEVEFSAVAEALAAIAMHNNTDNWRTGLRVELKDGQAGAAEAKAAARAASMRAEVGSLFQGQVNSIRIKEDGRRVSVVKRGKKVRLESRDTPEAIQSGDFITYRLCHDAEEDEFYIDELEPTTPPAPTPAERYSPGAERSERKRPTRRRYSAGAKVQQPHFTQARGPDGTKGFAPGRGRPSASE